jgi:hypothetical protein
VRIEPRRPLGNVSHHGQHDPLPVAQIAERLDSHSTQIQVAQNKTNFSPFRLKINSKSIFDVSSDGV